MRARFINEIKRGISRLGPLGVGREAMLFSRELEKGMRSFRDLETLDQYVITDNSFFKDLRDEILRIFDVPSSKIKTVNFYVMPGDIRGKASRIFREDETINSKIVIPYPNFKEHKEYDKNGNVKILGSVQDGTYSDATVNIRTNLDYGIMKVTYDLNIDMYVDPVDADLVFCNLYVIV